MSQAFLFWLFSGQSETGIANALARNILSISISCAWVSVDAGYSTSRTHYPDTLLEKAISSLACAAGGIVRLKFWRSSRDPKKGVGTRLLKYRLPENPGILNSPHTSVRGNWLIEGYTNFSHSRWSFAYISQMIFQQMANWKRRKWLGCPLKKSIFDDQIAEMASLNFTALGIVFI